MSFVRHFRNVFAVSITLSLLIGCQSRERATVSFSYDVQPGRGLPPGCKTITIMPAKVGPNTDPKWSDLSATIIQSLVNDSRQRFHTDVTVSDRRDTQVTFDEADLRAAGMSTQSGGSGGQLLAAQAAVLSNINVKVDTKVGKQRTLSGLNLAGFGGHGWGGGDVDVQTSEVDTVTRSMTVQTEFKLVDTANNKVWEHYSPPIYSGTDRTHASPIFGSSRTEAELTPQDEIIAELVKRAAREFVSQLIPCRIDVQTDVGSSSNANCAQGVRMLRAENWDDAASLFKQALAENPNDHHAAFGAGIASEARGSFNDAVKYYKQACAGADNPEYQEALARAKAFGQRARK